MAEIRTCLNCHHFNYCKYRKDNRNYLEAINCHFYNSNFPLRYTLKEKNMEELKVTKDRVLEASKKCLTAKEVLKELFPEAFEEQYKDFDVFLYNDEIRIYYKDNFYDINCGHCSNGKLEAYKYYGNLLHSDLPNKLVDHIIGRLKRIR